MRCLQEVTQRFLEALTPSPPLTIDKWLAERQGVILPERGNAHPGPVNLALTPYLKFPLELFTDTSVERLGLCFARQLGKTTWLLCILGYIIDYDPGPTLLYYPTQDSGKLTSKDRIRPTILNTPTLARHMSADGNDFQLLSYTFDRCTIRYGHAGSEVGGRSQPIRYLLKDETSAMTSSASENADDTTSSFWNRRIVEASTPMTQGDNMLRFLGLQPVEGRKGEQLWDTDSWEPKSITTVFFQEVPCPHCGKFIQFLWRQLKWPTDIAIRNIPEKAWYECQKCKSKITDGDKPKMLKAGRWTVHPIQKKMKRGKWVGLHMNKMYGPWDSCSFGSIAHGGFRARKSKDPQVIARFVNNSLALPYSIEQESIELVDEGAITQNVLGYQRNTIPDDCRVLSIGIDVGKMTASRVHWIVQGFGPHSRSWRIAWGILDDLYQMEAYINETVFQHPKAGRMRILVGAADSRYNKPEVIRFCKKFRGRIYPIQGERYIKPDIAGASYQAHKAYQPERDDKGKPLPDSMTGYRINTVYWKQWLYGQINCLYKQKQTFFFPIDRDEVLERHLRSEHEVLSTKRGSAEVIRSWQTRPGYEANHYLDAVIYGIAIADVFGLLSHLESGPIYTAIKATQKKVAPSSGGNSNPMGFPTDYQL